MSSASPKSLMGNIQVLQKTLVEKQAKHVVACIKVPNSWREQCPRTMTRRAWVRSQLLVAPPLHCDIYVTASSWDLLNKCTSFTFLLFPNFTRWDICPNWSPDVMRLFFADVLNSSKNTWHNILKDFHEFWTCVMPWFYIARPLSLFTYIWFSETNFH